MNLPTTYLVILLILVIIAILVLLLKMKKRLVHSNLNSNLNQNSESNLAENSTSNDNSFVLNYEENDYAEIEDNFIDIDANSENAELQIQQEAVSNVGNYTGEKSEIYYIVKETIKTILGNSVVSINEDEFHNKNLFTSKADARLYYDKKIEVSMTNEATKAMFTEYELYIVNGKMLPINPKKYLLIDKSGKEQTEGRKFESFILNQFANDLRLNNNPRNSSISTKNSFLDGDYKD